MATAAFAAAALAKDFFSRGHAALFQCLGNKSIHPCGHFLQHILSGDKGLYALMRIRLILHVLKLADLIGCQFLTTAMTLLKRAAQIHHIAVKRHGRFIGKEGFRLGTGALHVGIRSDGGAEGFDMGDNGRSKGSSHGRRCYLKNGKSRTF